MLLQDVEGGQARPELGSGCQSPSGPRHDAAGPRRPRVIANLGRIREGTQPDRGAGPGAALGNPPVDSDPYAFTPYRGGFVVVDAAANDLSGSPLGRRFAARGVPHPDRNLTHGRSQGLPDPSSVTTTVPVRPEQRRGRARRRALRRRAHRRAVLARSRPRLEGAARPEAESVRLGLHEISDLAFEGTEPARTRDLRGGAGPSRLGRRAHPSRARRAADHSRRHGARDADRPRRRRRLDLRRELRDLSRCGAGPHGQVVRLRS